MKHSRGRSLVCALALFALALPAGSASGAGQEETPLKRGGHQPVAVEMPTEAVVLDEVDEAIQQLLSRGKIRQLRIGKTGRAAVVYGDLDVAGKTSAPDSAHAVEFLAENRVLVGASDVAAELALERQIESPAGTHVVFHQKVGGLPVFDARTAVHVARDGKVFGLTSTFAPGIDQTLGSLTPSIAEETALAIALDRLSITSDALRREDAPIYELGVVPEGAGRLAWRVVVPVAEPFGQWEIFVDGGTGDVIGEPRSLVVGMGDAKVFVPNPVVSTGRTDLVDSNNSNAAVPESAYSTVELRGLDSSGFLNGPYVTTDRTPNRFRATNGDFSMLRRADQAFNEVEAYWAIDMAQRYIQSLGFSNIAHYPIRINTYAFADDNSNYTASGNGTGVLNFGYGGVDDAQDAEIVWHEYGHAILDNQARIQFSSESGAIHEGWADYVAATLSTTVPGDARFHVFVGEWDAVSYSGAPIPHLRRVDTKKRYPDDIRRQVHSDGEIWSSCLWTIHQSLGRDAANRIIFNANFLFPRDVGFEVAAAAVLEADRQINGGANAGAIVAAFGQHGIQLAPATPTITNVRVKQGKKMLVDGAAFETLGAVIEVDGVPFDKMKYPKKFRNNGISTRIASKASAVKALTPGRAVQVTVFNPSTGVRSAPFTFTP